MADMNWPFQKETSAIGWQEFSADGFDTNVYGCVYPAKELSCEFPLGGLGTGYMGITPQGKIGSVSIYNEHVPPPAWNKDWLSVSSGTVCEPLSSADRKVWGHFPVYDCKAAFRVLKISMGIRIFTPFVPGDACASGAPAALFEIRVHNQEPTTREFEINLRFPPAARKLTTCALRLSQQTQSPNYRLQIKPGGVSTLRGVFAWSAPNWRDSGNEAHVNFYSALYPSAAETAKFFLDEFDETLRRSLAWQHVIYETDYPVWVKDALVQNMYSLAKNTVWIAKTRKDEWWSEKTGWFSHNESHSGCPITETMVCRMHGHFPILFFFPELEESALRAFCHFQLEDGEIPFSFGESTSLRDVRYHCQHPLNAGYYAQQLVRWLQRTGNESAFAQYFPSLKKAVRYHYSLDDDGDGLVNDQPHVLPGEIWPANQFYDLWPWWGTSVYVAGVWLATLRAGVLAAQRMKDSEFENECQAAYQRGILVFNEKLWRGDYYRLWSNAKSGESCEVSLGNQLMMEWCAAILGGGSIAGQEQIQPALDAVWNLNAAATPFGLVNGVTPDGKKFYSIKHEQSRGKGQTVLETVYDENNDHSAQIFIGESFAAAMTFIWHGRQEQGMEIAKRLYETIALHSRTPWDQRCLYESASGMPAWGNDYYSNMIQWLLPVALSGKSLTDYFADPDNLVNRIIESSMTRSKKI